MFSIKATHGFAQTGMHDGWLINFQLPSISRTLIKCICIWQKCKRGKV